MVRRSAFDVLRLYTEWGFIRHKRRISRRAGADFHLSSTPKSVSSHPVFPHQKDGSRKSNIRIFFGFPDRQTNRGLMECVAVVPAFLSQSGGSLHAKHDLQSRIFTFSPNLSFSSQSQHQTQLHSLKCEMLIPKTGTGVRSDGLTGGAISDSGEKAGEKLMRN